MSWGEKLRLSLTILPVAALVFLVLGTIYTGIATPTEAASLGVVGAFVLALFSGKVNRSMLGETFLNTVNTTAMVILIVSAAFMLNFVLAIFGVPQAGGPGRSPGSAVQPGRSPRTTLGSAKSDVITTCWMRGSSGTT